MITSLYRRHLHKLRDIIYERKLRRYDIDQSTRNRTELIVGGPAGIFGWFYGKNIRKRLRETRAAGVRGLLKSFYGPLSYIILLFVLLVTVTIVFALLSLITDSSASPGSLYQTFLGVSFLMAAVPNLHARYHARQDFKTATRLERLVDTCSVENIDDAIMHLDHHQYRVQVAACQVVVSVLDGSPGKAVKYSSHSPEKICDLLIQRVQDGDRQLQTVGARGLDWLSRDYGQHLLPHAELFANLVRSDHSPLQVHATTVLGNLPLSNQDRRISCAKAIKPAVQDPDADVRQAAAIALGQVRCEPALQMLRYLTNDSDPNVRQRASASLQTLTA